MDKDLSTQSAVSAISGIDILIEPEAEAIDPPHEEVLVEATASFAVPLSEEEASSEHPSSVTSLQEIPAALAELEDEIPPPPPSIPPPPSAESPRDAAMARVLSDAEQEAAQLQALRDEAARSEAQHEAEARARASEAEAARAEAEAAERTRAEAAREAARLLSVAQREEARARAAQQRAEEAQRAAQREEDVRQRYRVRLHRAEEALELVRALRKRLASEPSQLSVIEGRVLAELATSGKPDADLPWTGAPPQAAAPLPAEAEKTAPLLSLAPAASSAPASMSPIGPAALSPSPQRLAPLTPASLTPSGPAPSLSPARAGSTRSGPASHSARSESGPLKLAPSLMTPELPPLAPQMPLSVPLVVPQRRPPPTVSVEPPPKPGRLALLFGWPGVALGAVLGLLGTVTTLALLRRPQPPQQQVAPAPEPEAPQQRQPERDGAPQENRDRIEPAPQPPEQAPPPARQGLGLRLGEKVAPARRRRDAAEAADIPPLRTMEDQPSPKKRRRHRRG